MKTFCFLSLVLFALAITEEDTRHIALLRSERSL